MAKAKYGVLEALVGNETTRRHYGNCGISGGVAGGGTRAAFAGACGGFP